MVFLSWVECVGASLVLGDGRPFEWVARDHSFLPAQGDRLLISLRMLNPPNMYLFFEYKVSFYLHHLFNDGNDRDVALLAYRGHGLNWPVDRNPLDLHFLVLEHLVDHLLIVVSNSRHAHPRRFHNALGNGEILFKDRDNSLPGRIHSRGFHGRGFIDQRIHEGYL